MCGIAGVLYRDASRCVDPAVLERMAGAIAHRGPDATGYWRGPGVGLAHRRLSIIDLAGSDQPIANETGSLQVIFNGELYNYQHLRRQLLDRGHVLRTGGDTETLVHLYEDHGDALVDSLRGMFAFALWDAPNRRLLLARDRIGIKPLYVYRDAGQLVFASEVKAILAHPGVGRDVDMAALDEYLAYGMVSGSRSIFSRIEKLPAAHVLAVAQADLTAAPRRYWSLVPRTDHQCSTGEWIERVRAKVDEAVRIHLIADVPVGAFLSGGVDSSVVVGTAVRHAEGRVQTFTMGFEEQEFSELPYAREVAERFGTVHHEAIVTPDAIEILDRIVHHYDEPFADSSAVPTFLVSKLASEHVKVVVSGDGGDEAFGGYPRYAHDAWEAGLRQRVPPWMRSSILAPLGAAWPKSDWLPRPLRAKTLLQNLSREAPAAYANSLAICRPPLHRRLLAADIRARLNGSYPGQSIERAFAARPAADPIGAMIGADIDVRLPDDYLVKVDRASMSHGLEVRPPLLDHELLELTAGMPSALKVRDGQTKWIFKQAYADFVPRTVTTRRKQGFEIPIDRWLRGPLREMFESVVLDRSAPVRQYVDQGEVAGMYRAHLRRQRRHGSVLWALLVLARWVERYRPA